MTPTQINHLIPPDAAIGAAHVTVKNANGVVANELAPIAKVAPAVFTADGGGRGLPAGVVFRATADSAQHYKPVVKFDSAQYKFVAISINLCPSPDQIVLILFATGLRFRGSNAAVSGMIEGESAKVLSAGGASRLIRPGSGRHAHVAEPCLALVVNVALTADGQTANNAQINIK
ncbi:MAG TPA: hypothetical protein VFV58_15520 [Blastocatellia bacterium]|jgi:uncharacterized protein (TIGR03437 family)|nr:hypothetical protein [Blastocatellia bacterium]